MVIVKRGGGGLHHKQQIGKWRAASRDGSNCHQKTGGSRKSITKLGGATRSIVGAVERLAMVSKRGMNSET